MTIESIEYKAGSVAARGSLVYDEKVNGPRPLLLIAPNWLGVSDASNKRAAEMAGSNYIAFVADMYGNGKIPAGPQEAAPLANALRADAPERRRRIVAALETLRAESRKRGIGDLSRQAAAGFCFGGGNVLELARTGADVKAVVCSAWRPSDADPGESRRDQGGGLRPARLCRSGCAEKGSRCFRG